MVTPWMEIYARGIERNQTPPFVPTSDPHDNRHGIPPGGLRVYWYLALPAKAVGKRQSVGWRIMETDLVFFLDREDSMRALWDYCPNSRGLSLLGRLLLARLSHLPIPQRNF